MANLVDGWTVPGFTHVRGLGRGASGRVVLAVDDLTQTKVAIKYLDRRLLDDERFMTRFRADSRRLSQLEDPNVVDFYEFVESPDGRGAAVVMERLEGVSLRRVLATQGPTGPLAALAVLAGSLVGLATAHGSGVAHQDFKPSNILIDANGNSRLCDFGVTPPRKGNEPPGTGGYLAPELWDGEEGGPPADLYAATVVFFECLTGRRPFEAAGHGAALAKAHREAQIPIDAVPGPLRGLIAQGMAKEPVFRPQSAADFLAGLEEAAVAAYGPSWEAQGRSRLTEMAGAAEKAPDPVEEPSAAPMPAGEGAPGRTRSRVAVAVVAGVVAVAGVLGATVVYGMDRGDEAEPLAAPSTPGPKPSGSASRSAKPADPAVAAAALAGRIDRAAGRRLSASFVHRRSFTDGRGGTAAQGAFRLVSGKPASYTMTVSGQLAELRRPARTLLLGDRGYVQIGRTWRPVPEVDDQTRGYAALAARVRWGTSMSNVTALLEASTKLRWPGKARALRTYRGTAPMSKLSKSGAVGPLYAELARGTKAKQVGFVIVLDRDNLPRQVRVTVSGSGGKPVVLTTSYAGWGRKVTIAAPR